MPVAQVITSNADLSSVWPGRRLNWHIIMVKQLSYVARMGGTCGDAIDGCVSSALETAQVQHSQHSNSAVHRTYGVCRVPVSIHATQLTINMHQVLYAIRAHLLAATTRMQNVRFSWNSEQ
jgi:hypothetical protein